MTVKIKCWAVAGVVLAVLVGGVLGWRWYRMANPPEGADQYGNATWSMVRAGESFAEALARGDAQGIAEQAGTDVTPELLAFVGEFGNRRNEILEYSHGAEAPRPGKAWAVIRVECSAGKTVRLFQMFVYQMSFLVLDHWVPAIGDVTAKPAHC